jgi:hypothetical protein
VNNTTIYSVRVGALKTLPSAKLIAILKNLQLPNRKFRSVVDLASIAMVKTPMIHRPPCRK